MLRCALDGWEALEPDLAEAAGLGLQARPSVPVLDHDQEACNRMSWRPVEHSLLYCGDAWHAVVRCCRLLALLLLQVPEEAAASTRSATQAVLDALSDIALGQQPQPPQGRPHGAGPAASADDSAANLSLRALEQWPASFTDCLPALHTTTWHNTCTCVNSTGAHISSLFRPNGCVRRPHAS